MHLCSHSFTQSRADPFTTSTDKMHQLAYQSKNNNAKLAPIKKISKNILPSSPLFLAWTNCCPAFFISPTLPTASSYSLSVISVCWTRFFTNSVCKLDISSKDLSADKTDERVDSMFSSNAEFSDSRACNWIGDSCDSIDGSSDGMIGFDISLTFCPVRPDVIPSNHDVSFPTPSLAASLAACPPRLLFLSSLLRLLSSCRSVRLADVFASLSLRVQRTDDRCALINGSNGSDEGARDGNRVWSLDNGAFWTCRATNQPLSRHSSRGSD